MFKKAFASLITVVGLIALASPSIAGNKVPAKSEPVVTVKKIEKPKHVDLVMILDQSGSMGGLTSDTIGGYNSMLDKQRNSGTEVSVTTVLFNNVEKTLYDRKAIKDVPLLTSKEYIPQNTTALLDATGNTLNRMKSVKGINDKGNKVIVVLITDGMENSSKEYTRANVKNMISNLQEQQNWEFVFLGANIDAVSEAGSLGINTKNAVKYKNTREGVKANYDAVGTMVNEAAGAVPQEERTWQDKVVKDK